MAKKHSKAVDNFNEELLRYIMDSVYYTGLGEGDDEGAGVSPMDYAPLLSDAKSYREARNRIIKKVQDDGNIDFLLPAIEAYNYDYGNPEAGVNYTPESFDVSKLKKEPIEVSQMSLQDVDAMTSAIADFLGYADNGDKERGKIDALLKQYYVGDKGVLGNIADAHAGDYSFYNEPRALSDALRAKIADNPSEQDRLYRMLGITPDTDMEEVLNIDKGLPAYATRSYRAFARGNGIPAKAVSTIEGMLLAPQMAQKWDEGKTPQMHDVVSDVTETAALGALKGATPLKAALKRAGAVSGLDALHDAVDDALNEKVYSGGEFPDSGKDYSDIADANRLGGLVAGLGIRGAGAGIVKAANNGIKRFAQKSDMKVDALQKGAEKVRKETSQGLAEIEKRKQDIVAKMEDKKSALNALNASRKSTKKEKVSMDEFSKGLQADLNDANIDQTRLEKSALKALAEANEKIRNEKQKKALVQLFGQVPAERMLYNDYARKQALESPPVKKAISVLPGAQGAAN